MHDIYQLRTDHFYDDEASGSGFAIVPLKSTCSYPAIAFSSDSVRVCHLSGYVLSSENPTVEKRKAQTT
jgi:hypothetical protein